MQWYLDQEQVDRQTAKKQSQDGISYNSFGEAWKDIKILALDPTRSLNKQGIF